MAPVDRNEHRQQRMRGAGITSVQTNFAFSFAGLAKSLKQSSLPPQRSSRRTPVQNTPLAADGSVKQHRSASLPRSSIKARSNTPSPTLVTPQLGKRKRGSKHADAAQEDGDVDELSPDRDGDNDAPSIEKSRKVAATISPIREEMDGLPDELSFMGDIMSSAQKGAQAASEAAPETPVPAPAMAQSALADGRQRTPISARIGNMAVVSRQEIVRSGKSKSIEPPPTTPAGAGDARRRRSSAARFGPDFTTPGGTQGDEDDEDELSPNMLNIVPTQTKTKSPRPLPKDNGGIDELSPPQAKTTELLPKLNPQKPEAPKEQPIVKPGRGRRPRRIVEDDEDVVQSTPVATKPRRLKGKAPNNEVEEDEEEVPDELSPENERTVPHHIKPMERQQETQVILSDPESYGDDGEPDQDEVSVLASRPPPIAKPRSPPKKKQRTRPADDEPPKKRQKRGPTHAIQVMRLKGFPVKGISIVDTTRHEMGDWLASRLRKIDEKLSNITDAVRRKAVSHQKRLMVQYLNQLDDALLELDDANNSGNANANRLQQFNKDNKRLRNEYLAVQRNRDQVALQNDEVTEGFLLEKNRIEETDNLSVSLYDIQAAIQNGKEKARSEGRENEGPEIPLKMLLDNVARGVGHTGGLWSHVRNFNGVLDKAAEFLEGRA